MINKNNLKLNDIKKIIKNRIAEIKRLIEKHQLEKSFKDIGSLSDILIINKTLYRKYFG